MRLRFSWLQTVRGSAVLDPQSCVKRPASGHRRPGKVSPGPIRHLDELGRYTVVVETVDGRTGTLSYEIVRRVPAGYLGCGGTQFVRRSDELPRS